MKTIIITLSTLLLFVLNSSAQEILFLEGNEPGKGKIEELSFIEGKWKGKMGNNFVEEHWASPVDGQMMGMFRMYDESLNVYEFMTIVEHEGSLIIKIKHFSKAFEGWEEKDKWEEFKLVKIEDEVAYFDGFTMQKDGDQLKMNLIVDEKEGEKINAQFIYTAADQ